MDKNDRLTDLLEDIADYLELTGENRYKIRSYRQAARALSETEVDVDKAFSDRGKEALTEIPGVGEGIGRVLEGYLRSGRSQLLEDLKSQTTPRSLFAELPGIGEELADRIVEELGAQSYPELEQAAHDGRLAEIEGFGEERVEAIRQVLAAKLSRSTQRRTRGESLGEEKHDEPSVATLLEVDRTYREKAEAGVLRRIAPKRFNPEGEAWLPVMETDRDGWHFSALYSNTKRAHDAGKTGDWVVLYYRSDGEEDQCTVVTGRQGSLKGKRVVRGREAECRDYYEK